MIERIMVIGFAALLLFLMPTGCSTPIAPRKPGTCGFPAEEIHKEYACTPEQEIILNSLEGSPGCALELRKAVCKELRYIYLRGMYRVYLKEGQ